MQDLGERYRGERRLVDVLCVYGPSYLDQVANNLIPALKRQHGVEVRLHVVNYAEASSLLPETVHGLRISDWSSSRAPGRLGFGEAVNLLFMRAAPSSTFVVANPDTVPTSQCIATLLQTLDNRSAGLVEARQWPSEHPKEYSIDTLQTPWSSGAFFAASPDAFASIGGFDDLFFLYNEDVDLSWRLRLAGWNVLYEPAALVYRFTGLHRYNDNSMYYEHFYSARNFLVLGRKFWGESGECATKDMLSRTGYPKGFEKFILNEYEKIKDNIQQIDTGPPNRWIKIVGFNLYHDLRTV